MRGRIRQHARRVRSPEKIVVVEKGSFVINSESWRTMPSGTPIQEIVRRTVLRARLLKRAIEKKKAAGAPEKKVG